MIPRRCRDLEEGLRDRVAYGMDRRAVMAWLDEFTDIDDCIAAGIQQARLDGDWEMFEKYLFAADRHPSRLYTAELCEALRRHRDEVNVDDVLFTLAGIRDPDSVDCLEEIIWWEPDWDEYRSVAVKAVWTLKAIGTARALSAIRDAESCEAEPIRKAASEALGGSDE